MELKFDLGSSQLAAKSARRELAALPAAVPVAADVPDAAEEAPEKPKRVRAKWCFLTYSQCPYDPESILAALEDVAEAKFWMGVEEKHKDGEPHSHILVNWSDKPNLPMDGLDFLGDNGETYHCNIQTAGPKSEKNQQLKWRRHKIAYIHKIGGKYPVGNFDAWSTDDWRGYQANKRDFMAWRADRLIKATCYPFRIPYWNDLVLKPGPGDKKIHWLLWSEPGYGKTPWVENTFEGKSVFRRSMEAGLPYEGYAGEEIIICDDVVPSREEVIWMSEYRKIECRVWGGSRYAPCYMKLRQRTMFIVITNDLWRVNWSDDPAMRARFNCRQLKRNAPMMLEYVVE